MLSAPSQRLRDRYTLGPHITEEIQLFGYPRVGSHYFAHCLNGLYDLVVLPHEHLDNPEAIARQDEVEFSALYGLDLREDGAPHRPLFLNPLAAGQHGLPLLGPHRRILLLRHPLPTLYSFYRANRDRWGAAPVADLGGWLEERLAAFLMYYAAGFAVHDAEPERTLLVRYEAMVEGAETLREIVAFVGMPPKLAPEFVHWVTAFARFARPESAGRGPRTFYREGRDLAYQDDPVWRELADALDPSRWEHLGYGPRPC